ncbi:hypothetical protein IKQ21_05475 [bacterium]|nr:hypothetical protein [bacterium]
MEIKCNFHHQIVNNNYTPKKERVPEFRGYESVLLREVGESADKFVRRPVAMKSATGLHGLGKKLHKAFAPVRRFTEQYKHNIKHTYDHKIIFAMVEKELFGTNSIDSITHDLDKLILYSLGFSKSFVSKFHRKHSEHHCESGKRPNLRSMICDNVASSPEFKPEKKLSLRDYYQSSEDLQSVEGLGDILEKYNYGENIDFSKIKRAKSTKQHNALRFVADIAKVIPLVLASLV